MPASSTSFSKIMRDDGATCSRCKGPLIEIDHYGERLTGCIECNCWRGSNCVMIELPDEDVDALKGAKMNDRTR